MSPAVIPARFLKVPLFYHDPLKPTLHEPKAVLRGAAAGGDGSPLCAEHHRVPERTWCFPFTLRQACLHCKICCANPGMPRVSYLAWNSPWSPHSDNGQRCTVI